MKYSISMGWLQGQVKKLQKEPGKNLRDAQILAWLFLQLLFNLW